MCGMFVAMILRVQHLLFGLLIKILLYKFLSNLLETCLKQNLLLFFLRFSANILFRFAGKFDFKELFRVFTFSP